MGEEEGMLNWRAEGSVAEMNMRRLHTALGTVEGPVAARRDGQAGEEGRASEGEGGSV